MSPVLALLTVNLGQQSYIGHVCLEARAPCKMLIEDYIIAALAIFTSVILLVRAKESAYSHSCCSLVAGNVDEHISVQFAQLPGNSQGLPQECIARALFGTTLAPVISLSRFATTYAQPMVDHLAGSAAAPL